MQTAQSEFRHKIVTRLAEKWPECQSVQPASWSTHGRFPSFPSFSSSASFCKVFIHDSISLPQITVPRPCNTILSPLSYFTCVSLPSSWSLPDSSPQLEPSVSIASVYQDPYVLGLLHREGESQAEPSSLPELRRWCRVSKKATVARVRVPEAWSGSSLSTREL